MFQTFNCLFLLLTQSNKKYNKILQIYVHFPPINQNILQNYAEKKINSTPMNYSPIPRKKKEKVDLSDKIYFINILHHKKTFHIFAIVQSKRETSILQYFLICCTYVVPMK